MLCAVMVGVALAGEVKAGFWQPYPLKYGVIGCVGLAGYLLSLLWIQLMIEHRVAHRFATAKVRMFGVILALVTIPILPLVPSLIGNLLWGTALISQIAYPVTRAYYPFKRRS